ncbi:hypothetical protein [Actinophytocola sediminis]
MTAGVPEDLLAEVARFDDALAQLDGDLARAWELEVPEIEPMDPDVLAQAATDPDAAPALRAVAAAVAEGRTRWTDLAGVGGATDMPEVRDLYAAGAEHVRQMLDEERAGPATGPAPTAVADEDDFSTDSIYDPS